MDITELTEDEKLQQEVLDSMICPVCKDVYNNATDHICEKSVKQIEDRIVEEYCKSIDPIIFTFVSRLAIVNEISLLEALHHSLAINYIRKYQDTRWGVYGFPEKNRIFNQ